MFSIAVGLGCEASPLAASFLMHSTLELGHLCLLAVLWELNLHPHALHCHLQGGCLATFTASCSLSHLAAQLLFHARHLFSFWALLRAEQAILGLRTVQRATLPEQTCTNVFANSN